MCHYKTLGVPRDAPKAAIRKAYISKAKEFHPDVSGHSSSGSSTSILSHTVSNEEKFKQIQAAYSILSDESQRKDYDAKLGVWQNFRSTGSSQYGVRNAAGGSTDAYGRTWRGGIDGSGDVEFSYRMNEQAERLRKERENFRNAFDRQRQQMEYGYNPEGYHRQRPSMWPFAYSQGISTNGAYPPSVGRTIFAFQLLRVLPLFVFPLLLFSVFYTKQKIPPREGRSGHRIPVHHDTFGRAFIVDSYGRKHRFLLSCTFASLFFLAHESLSLCRASLVASV